MKKVFYTLLLLPFCLNAQNSPYIPTIVNGTMWLQRLKEHNSIGAYSILHHVQGDTVVGNRSYKKIYNCSRNRLAAITWEDTLQKRVYLRQFYTDTINRIKTMNQGCPADTTILWYSYNLADTALMARHCFLNDPFYFLTVGPNNSYTNSDSLLYGGRWRKRHNYGNNPLYPSYSLIEGFGMGISSRNDIYAGGIFPTGRSAGFGYRIDFMHFNIYPNTTCQDIERILPTEEIDDVRNIKAYPNPADYQITFEWQHPNAQAAVIEIIDIAGKVAFTKTIDSGNTNTQINIQQLANGLYHYKIHFGNATSVGRFTILR